MSGGFKSLFGKWVGGISAPRDSIAGYRSLLAPWLGGISAPVSEKTGGYKSILCFWLGGLQSSRKDTSNELFSTYVWW